MAEIDAAVLWDNGKAYFFRGSDYVRYDVASDQVDQDARPIADGWPGLTGAAPGPSPTPTPGGTGFRDEILRLLAHFEGAVEGDPVFEKEFMAHATLEEQRKASGREGRTYTTCIDFQTMIFNRAAANAGITPKAKALGLLCEKNTTPVGAWHPGAAGMAERPRPGDILLLYKAESPNEFSHIGYLKSISNGGGTETWTTVDGGQGAAGKYDKNGNLIQAGRESIQAVARTYESGTNLIAGETSQGGKARVLRGWVDVDGLVG